MKLTQTFAIAVLLAGALSSCKDKLELNAPYKEIPSIYAVLNPQNKLQIIRVNKLFLGEGDATKMAQVADSVNYPQDELEITLTRRNEYGAVDNASKNGNPKIVFRDSVIQTVAGAFSKTQRVYVTSERLYTTGKYTLTVKNKKTGNVFTAQTTALDSVKGQQPFNPIGAPYYPYAPVGPPNDNSVHFINYKAGGAVQYLPDEKYGKFYNLTIRMHFYDSLYDGSKKWRYVDYQFANLSIKDALKGSSFSYMRQDFKSDDFFNAMAVGLSRAGLSGSDPILGRKMERVEYIIASTSQEYMDYMQYVSPSLSISQSKPLYSNFDGQTALGLFTFRARCSVSKELANEFITEFAYNRFTCSYGFYTAALAKPGCQ